eukprot:1193760-Prorocentrum_minimum.AAC.2
MGPVGSGPPSGQGGDRWRREGALRAPHHRPGDPREPAVRREEERAQVGEDERTAVMHALGAAGVYSGGPQKTASLPAS